MDFKQRLRDARIGKGLTQEALAKQLGVSRQTVINWENGRSTPDIGNVVKLGKLYDMSLDQLLNGEEVIRQMETMVEKRRTFWQGMLETGVILELLGILVRGLEFAWMGSFLSWAGALLLTLAMVMHLYVFDHDRRQILEGLAGLAVHWTLVLGRLLLPDLAEGIPVSLVQLISAVLIFRAGVWTVNWKSTRLWLIITLLVGTPLLVMGKWMQGSGQTVENTPFPGDYRVEAVLYPQEDDSYENALVSLGTNSLTLSMDGVEGDHIGMFSYCEPNLEDTAKGIWLLTPKEREEDSYRLTLEADDSVCLSYTQNGELRWKWKLVPDHRKASVSIATFGHTTVKSVTWYPEDADDPVPYFGNTTDVVINAKVSIHASGFQGKPLTVYEEYHHGEKVDESTYTLEANSSGAYTMKQKVRYKGIAEQYAICRIPFEGGEYRFVLTFAGLG